MPTTPGGIVYPDSSAHTRIWEHLEAQAESIDAAAGGELDKLPRGYLNYASRGGAQGIDTVKRNMVQAAVTVPAGRRLKVSGGMLFNAATNLPQQLAIGLYFNGAEQTNILTYVTSTGYYALDQMMIHAPAAGTHTYAVYAWTSAGTAQVNGGAPNFVLIEDVGGV